MGSININLKNKIIQKHLSINKRMVIFFTIVYFLITAALLAFTLIKHHAFVKIPYIAPTWTDARVNQEGNYANKGSIAWSVYEALSMVLYGGPGIVLFFIANIYFVNKVIIKELNEGQISIWMSFKISRFEVIISKILSILLFNFIIYIFSFILILIFSSIAQDAKQYIGFVFMYSIQFFVFIFLLISLLIFFSIWFNQKIVLINVIAGIFVFWVLLTWVLNLIYSVTGETIKLLKYVKYFSPQLLLLSVMNFNSEYDIVVEKFDYSQYEVFVMQSALKKVYWSVKVPVFLLMCGLTLVVNYYAIYGFKNKDLKI